MKMHYLHIGFPKTGTSFCQKLIFPYFKNAYYNPTYDLDKLDEILFNPFSKIKPERKKIDLKPIILSKESYIGSIFFGARDFKSNLEIIKSTFQNVKIIITIRDQTRLINSLYVQYVQQGGYKSLDKFLWGKAKYFGDDYFNADILRYDIVIKQIEKTFGENNLLVLNYRDLKNDPVDFIKQISRFMNLDIDTSKIDFNINANKSTPSFFIPIYRRLNPLFKSKFSNWSILGSLDNGDLLRSIFQGYLPKIFPLKNSYLLKQKHEDWIKNYYRSSNLVLKNEYKIIL